MTNLLTKSNSFKKFRSENKLDSDSTSNTSSRPKLFSKKSIKLFNNNTSLSLSNLNNDNKSHNTVLNNNRNLNLDVVTSNDNKANSTPLKPVLKSKNIVVRLNDYNRMNNSTPIHMKQSSISSSNVKNTRQNNMSLNKSASFNARNMSESHSLEEKPILEVAKTELNIPEPYINIYSQSNANTSMTLFGREDRRMKESLLIYDEKNYNYLNSLINSKNNKYYKLKLMDFDFKMYLEVLDKVKNVEIGIIDYYIKTITESNWVSYREITELKQRLNLITSSWDKRLDFYYSNMVI
ncbi:hypothetical protein FOG51_00612 [Hanseniaspora uvarum]|uniref:Uncharacterized protein n=1 Tax=Hanseniaspora uvarum TaxID=29833 RepID=A0A1E5RXY9_HANUV|nr:hypothetical protein FOG48_00441 [Hanseniaspora uvarum]KAF0274386.1 hypothetical protein FOG51_00612 [Hanseniaspora uvarum]OEJ91827.1 hypothetical protein AWRI3580_g848 [Hanseniaspora uvarum]